MCLIYLISPLVAQTLLWEEKVAHGCSQHGLRLFKTSKVVAGQSLQRLILAEMKY